MERLQNFVLYKEQFMKGFVYFVTKGLFGEDLYLLYFLPKLQTSRSVVGGAGRQAQSSDLRAQSSEELS
jgi:hypothetical protein